MRTRVRPGGGEVVLEKNKEALLPPGKMSAVTLLDRPDSGEHGQVVRSFPHGSCANVVSSSTSSFGGDAPLSGVRSSQPLMRKHPSVTTPDSTGASNGSLLGGRTRRFRRATSGSPRKQH